MIIIFGLHIDTWTDRTLGRVRKSRIERFLSFLDWCERTGAGEFIINGDLMDLPPYLGEHAHAASSAIVRTALEGLVEFACVVPVTYMFGNHDVGACGLRNFGLSNAPALW